MSTSVKRGGAQFLRPEECTRLDFDEISAAPWIVAFPGHQPHPAPTSRSAGPQPRQTHRCCSGEDRDYAFTHQGTHTVANRHRPDQFRGGEDITEQSGSTVNELADKTMNETERAAPANRPD